MKSYWKATEFMSLFKSRALRVSIVDPHRDNHQKLFSFPKCPPNKLGTAEDATAVIYTSHCLPVRQESYVLTSRKARPSQTLACVSLISMILEWAIFVKSTLPFPILGETQLHKLLCQCDVDQVVYTM